jgi:hypothetical protein
MKPVRFHVHPVCENCVDRRFTELDSRGAVCLLVSARARQRGRRNRRSGNALLATAPGGPCCPNGIDSLPLDREVARGVLAGLRAERKFFANGDPSRVLDALEKAAEAADDPAVCRLLKNLSDEVFIGISHDLDDDKGDDDVIPVPSGN